MDRRGFFGRVIVALVGARAVPIKDRWQTVKFVGHRCRFPVDMAAYLKKVETYATLKDLDDSIRATSH